MPKRIIFHVGAPKAGSTYLQKRLKSNTEALAQNGMCYPIIPRFDKVAANAKIVTLSIDSKSASQFTFNFPDLNISALDPQTTLDELLGICADHAETIVLSSEKMRPHHAARLASLFHKQAECEIILVVRKQDNWLDSYYNQRVKNRSVTQNARQFLHTILKPDQLDFFVPDWLMHFQEWKQHFEKVDVIFFDTPRQDLFNRFGQSIGVADTSTFHELEPQNESLSAFELTYILNLPADLPRAAFGRHKRVLSKVARAHFAKCRRFSFLSKTDRKILIDRFAQGNNQLLKTFDAKMGILDIEDEASNYIDMNDVRHSSEYKNFRDHVDSMLKAHANVRLENKS